MSVAPTFALLVRLLLLNSESVFTWLQGPSQRLSSLGSPVCSRQIMPVVADVTFWPRAIFDSKAFKFFREKPVGGFHSPPREHRYLGKG